MTRRTIGRALTAYIPETSLTFPPLVQVVPVTSSPPSVSSDVEWDMKGGLYRVFLLSYGASGTVLFVYCQSRRCCVALYCVYTTLSNTGHLSSGWVAVYLVHVLAGGARSYEVDKCCDCDVIMFEVADV